jgi:hypothetical protein
MHCECEKLEGTLSIGREILHGNKRQIFKVLGVKDRLPSSILRDHYVLIVYDINL